MISYKLYLNLWNYGRCGFVEECDTSKEVNGCGNWKASWHLFLYGDGEEGAFLIIDNGVDCLLFVVGKRDNNQNLA